MKLVSDPAKDPWRNGMTDAYLMNLGKYDFYKNYNDPFWAAKHLQNLDSQGVDPCPKGWTFVTLANNNFCMAPGDIPANERNTYLQNLDSPRVYQCPTKGFDLTYRVPGSIPCPNGWTLSPCNYCVKPKPIENPANEPWRNGMTDTYLQNLQLVHPPSISYGL